MKYSSQPHTMPLELFTSDLCQLSKQNRWVQLGDSLPWDTIEQIYNARLNNGKRGAGNKPARMIIGALLIKHKMNLSDYGLCGWSIRLYRPFQLGYACTGKMVIVGRIVQARRSKATKQDKISFPRVEIR